jgi:hypothetical protein
MPHDDGTASLYFEHFGHWGNFDCIVKLLEQENNCVIHNNDELTNRRIAKLSWNNISFEVRHDIMLGNFLYTANKKDLSVLNKLAENVIKSVSYK